MVPAAPLLPLRQLSLFSLFHGVCVCLSDWSCVSALSGFLSRERERERASIEGRKPHIMLLYYTIATSDLARQQINQSINQSISISPDFLIDDDKKSSHLLVWHQRRAEGKGGKLGGKTRVFVTKAQVTQYYTHSVYDEGDGWHFA